MRKVDANSILVEQGANALLNKFDKALRPSSESRVAPGDDKPPAAGMMRPRSLLAVKSRDDLLVSAWLKRQLPQRDYLLGNVFCTTSRWLIFGDTGIGKTLFAMSKAAAMASGDPFLVWDGRRKARVIYIDGEMPAETFKERMQLIADEFGEDLTLFGYNRDVLGPDEMQPLNTPEGAKWLWREIEAVKPDVIFFDSIMCLLAGTMGEEESWAPVKLLMRKISSNRIGQVWLHHTGHDSSRGFGTKTREWEMDTVVSLTTSTDERGSVGRVQEGAAAHAADGGAVQAARHRPRSKRLDHLDRRGNDHDEGEAGPQRDRRPQDGPARRLRPPR